MKRKIFILLFFVLILLSTNQSSAERCYLKDEENVVSGSSAYIPAEFVYENLPTIGWRFLVMNNRVSIKVPWVVNKGYVTDKGLSSGTGGHLLDENCKYYVKTYQREPQSFSYLLAFARIGTGIQEGECLYSVQSIINDWGEAYTGLAMLRGWVCPDLLSKKRFNNEQQCPLSTVCNVDIPEGPKVTYAYTYEKDLCGNKLVKSTNEGKPITLSVPKIREEALKFVSECINRRNNALTEENNEGEIKLLNVELSLDSLEFLELSYLGNLRNRMIDDDLYVEKQKIENADYLLVTENAGFDEQHNKGLVCQALFESNLPFSQLNVEMTLETRDNKNSQWFISRQEYEGQFFYDSKNPTNCHNSKITPGKKVCIGKVSSGALQRFKGKQIRCSAKISSKTNPPVTSEQKKSPQNIIIANFVTYIMKGSSAILFIDSNADSEIVEINDPRIIKEVEIMYNMSKFNTLFSMANKPIYLRRTCEAANAERIIKELQEFNPNIARSLRGKSYSDLISSKNTNNMNAIYVAILRIFRDCVIENSFILNQYDLAVGFNSAIFPEIGGYAHRLIPNAVYVQPETRELYSTLAHETGHKLGNYDDEYSYVYFSQQQQDTPTNKYPSCCFDNPYNSKGAKFNAFAQGIWDCEKIGGTCINTICKADEGAILNNSGGNGCTNSIYASCCMSKSSILEAGNSCNPPSIIKNVLTSYCAGMPIPNEDDLSSPYRSVMGGITTKLVNEGINPVYPAPSRYPLTSSEVPRR